MNISDEDNLPENIEIEGSEIEENSDDEQYDDEDVSERNTNIEEDDIPPLPPPISLPSFSPLTSPQPIAYHDQPSTTTDEQVIIDEYDSSDDYERIIDQYNTGYFIQDAMMHRPWKIFPMHGYLLD